MKSKSSVTMFDKFETAGLKSKPDTLTFELISIIAKSLATKFPALDLSMSLAKGSYPTLDKHPKFIEILTAGTDAHDLLNTLPALIALV